MQPLGQPVHQLHHLLMGQVPSLFSSLQATSLVTQPGAGEAVRSILPGSLHGDLAQRKSVVSTLTGSNRVRGKYDNLLDRPLHAPFKFNCTSWVDAALRQEQRQNLSVDARTGSG
jgi:hypothetical protein